jgi:uncharacterized membrane protein YgcG
MLGVARWTVLPGLVAGWLLLPAMALAIVPEVRDNGKFFDAQTVAKANTLIKKIEDKYKKDVAVVTFGEISDEVAKKFQYDPNDRSGFYYRWMHQLEEQGAVNGVVVLIVKDQHNQNKTHIEVGVGRETQKKAFTLENRDKLFNILKEEFKQPNKALLDGLHFIDDSMAANRAWESAPVAAQKPAHAPQTRQMEHDIGGSNILGWICIGLCVLAVIWLVRGLFRAMSGGTGGGSYAGGPAGYAGGGVGGGVGGGGGGFMSGLMGGLFGAVAGNWLYNNMFGGSSYHQSAWGAGNPSGGDTNAPNRDDFGPSDQGQGFSNTGGDVDDGGGGGGDVDGGDAGGGGDWGGGGDTGGGGGDWGGGGGDWGGGGGGDFGGGGGGGDW